MKIACISDLHGHLPDTTGLEFDLLLIGGDLTPCHWKDYLGQIKFLDGPFRDWLGSIKVPVVGVAGNHDGLFQARPDLVPKLPWTYLQDSGIMLSGLQLSIYGSPWQPWFGGWAFNLHESQLKTKWSPIPDGLDVLLLHGPPYGLGDIIPFSGHVGSKSLRDKIKQARPRLVVYGHIHVGHGIYREDNSIFVNAALVDKNYKLAHPISLVELDTKIST